MQENLKNSSQLERGKLPPQAVDLEQAILGAMFIDVKGVDECLAIITIPDVFYKPSHAVIFEAIQQLYNLGNPVDLLTVSAQLKLNGKLDLAGGDFYLIQLSQKVSSSAHIDYHCRIVLQKYMARQTIKFSEMIISLAYDDTTDIFDLMQRWQKEFDKVADVIDTGRSSISFPVALNALLKNIEMLTSNKEEVKLVGTHTGFKSINKFTGGYRVQDLIILAARPGMGKTAYVLKMVIENCKLGVPVGFISLEMSVHQLTARAVALDTSFHLGQLLKKGFEKNDYFVTYKSHQERMNKYPFYIDDSGKSDITDIVIKAKLWKRKYDIQLLVVDYLQLITDKSAKGNRENEIGNASRRLKRLAKELDIPVIALAQLSRAVETRGGSKRPLLSDLRESGSIEQDADIVQFIYRPGYYNIDLDIEDYDVSLQPAISEGADTEIIFAKYRGGSLATTMLKWVGDKTKFVDVMDEKDTVEYIYSDYQGLPRPSVKEAFDVKEDNNELPGWLK